MKKLLCIIGGLALITIGHYMYRRWPRSQQLESAVEKAGVVWPEGTEFEISASGEPIFILKESLQFGEGDWPKETKVYFEEDKIIGIETFNNFEFAQFEFYQAAKIAFSFEESNPVHVVELSEKAEFDGLPLKPGCLLKFVNYVLDKASCDNFENIAFKRKLEMPEVRKLRAK